MSASPSRTLRPVILWGGKGHAKVLQEFLPQIGYRAIAVFDNDPTSPSPLRGVPIHYGLDGFRAWLAEQPRDGSIGGLVAIGGPRGGSRIEILDRFREAGIEPLTVRHPRAFVAEDATLGAGSQVLANASVCAEAVIGRGCIINTNASVDHETHLGDGVHVAPGATITGCVSVGSRTMIGAGATILPRLTIGCDVIVGAGSVVTRSIPDGQVAYGNPARVRHPVSA